MAQEAQDVQPRPDYSSEAEQVRKFGFPLKHFRNEGPMRKDVIGGRNKKTLYSISRFNFQNMHETNATIEETLIECLNDFVSETVKRADAVGKNTTLVMNHDGLREWPKSFFCNLNKHVNAGEAIIAFIERFSQSNDHVKIQDNIEFDLWISN